MHKNKDLHSKKGDPDPLDSLVFIMVVVCVMIVSLGVYRWVMGWAVI